jgi:hypothetical protein
MVFRHLRRLILGVATNYPSALPSYSLIELYDLMRNAKLLEGFSLSEI